MMYWSALCDVLQCAVVECVVCCSGVWCVFLGCVVCCTGVCRVLSAVCCSREWVARASASHEQITHTTSKAPCIATSE